MKLNRCHIRNAYHPASKDSCGWRKVVVLNSRFLFTQHQKQPPQHQTPSWYLKQEAAPQQTIVSAQFHIRQNAPPKYVSFFSQSLKGIETESSEDCTFIRACVTLAFSWRFLCAENTSRDLLEGYWSGASHSPYTYPINVCRLYRTHNYCCLDLAIPCLFQQDCLEGPLDKRGQV